MSLNPKPLVRNEISIILLALGFYFRCFLYTGLFQSAEAFEPPTLREPGFGLRLNVKAA